MIKRCKISGNDFVSKNGEDICDMYLQAYNLGFEEGKLSVAVKEEVKEVKEEEVEVEIIN